MEPACRPLPHGQGLRAVFMLGELHLANESQKFSSK